MIWRLSAGCATFVEVPIETPLQSKIDVASFRRVAERSGQVMLFYGLQPNASWLWVVTPKDTQLVPLPAGDQIELLVREQAARDIAIERVKGCVAELHGIGVEVIDSPITGMEGNHEYLLHATFGVK